PIYYAGGTAAKDISSGDILAGIKTAGKSAELIGERLQFFHIPVKWDTYVVLGARDDSLSDFAREIAEKL
ncbi:MAG: hypothetical protein H6R43_95, partial [Nitrospirae bacterium]|nr:hypothetical protein [Nitrospirota bacterium]